MDLPSKDEIKEKYGISDDDFEILTASEPPDPKQLQSEQAYLEKAGWWKGAEVWFKRIVGGSIKAVIFIGAFVAGAHFLKFDHYLYYGRDQVISFVQKLPEHLKDEADRYIVSQETESPEDQQHRKEFPQEPMIFPTGTLVAPVSGSYLG